METTLLGPEWRWEKREETPTTHATYSLECGDSDDSGLGFIVNKLPAHAWYKNTHNTFDSVEDAMRWCEIMVLMGA